MPSAPAVPSARIRPDASLLPREHGAWAIVIGAWLCGALMRGEPDVASLGFVLAIFLSRRPLLQLRKARAAAWLAVLAAAGAASLWSLAPRVPPAFFVAAGALAVAFLVLGDARSPASLVLAAALLSLGGPLAAGGSWLLWWLLFAHFASAALAVIWAVRRTGAALWTAAALAAAAAATWIARVPAPALAAALFALPIGLAAAHVALADRRAIRRLGWSQTLSSLVIVVLVAVFLRDGTLG